MSDVPVTDPNRAEPNRQVEVQLGHLCNNRCVFCVSGQLSELDRAPQLPQDPIRAQVQAARDDGATKITFLGGEPTIQRSFLDLLQFAVDLQFDEIVIFTNGVMTPRESFRSRALRILAGLGDDVRERVIWRFSLQGGDRESHDATTCNPGAWDRIIESMGILAGENARLSGNMCVVSGNHLAVDELADVAAKFGLENLHLDMFRPRDSGDRTEDYLRGLMSVPYTEMATSFRKLVQAVEHKLGAGFDLNIGNLPYCVAPDIAWRIHHDGQFTVTVAASGSGHTQDGFDKYTDKRSDKHKTDECAACVFNDRCGGVFDLYADIHGHDELRPVSGEQLWQVDEAGHHFVLLAEDAVRTWADGNERRVGRIDERGGEIDVSVTTPAGPWRLILRRSARATNRPGWHRLRGGRIEASVVAGAPSGDSAHAALQSAWNQLVAALDPAGEASIDGLAEAWNIESARIEGERARLAGIKRRAAAMIDRLRGERLAGLRLDSVSRDPDVPSIDLTYVGADATLVLSLDLHPPAPATRPALRHRTEDLGPETLARFSAELGRALKPRRSRARA